jgi:amino acid transporter
MHLCLRNTRRAGRLIIGWDLVLEYSLSSSTVAVGWSGYFVTLLGEMGIRFPARLTGAPGTHVCLPDGSHVTAIINLPAILICLAITGLLVLGIRESARANTTIVIIKLVVLTLFIAVGVRYINPLTCTVHSTQHRHLRPLGAESSAAPASSSSPTSDSTPSPPRHRKREIPAGTFRSAFWYRWRFAPSSTSRSDW